MPGRGGQDTRREAARGDLRGAPGGVRAAPVLRALALAAFALAGAGCGRAGEEAAHEVLHAIDQGKLAGTRGTMETLGRALQAYAVDKGGYPAGASIAAASAALVPAFLPAAATTDAWGNALVYRSEGRTFTLVSPGADGRAGTPDDLVMTDGRFTRLPAPPAR